MLRSVVPKDCDTFKLDYELFHVRPQLPSSELSCKLAIRSYKHHELNVRGGMEYLEALPDECPIDQASDRLVNVAYRVVASTNPTVDDFLSNAARNVMKPATVDSCRWASCSLFISRDQVLNIASKLPKTRIANPHVAMCTIKPGIGKSYINKKKHVDFWPFKNFDPGAVIVKIEKV